jgi:hypothetical protein
VAVLEADIGHRRGKRDRNGRRPLIREENLIETAADGSFRRKT